MTLPQPALAPAPAPQAAPPPRLALIDLLRGLALVAMVAYHLCWDLTFFRLTRFDLLNDPWWLLARSSIAGSFLGLAGLCLVLTHGRGVRWRPLARRTLVLAAAAGIVSAVSFTLFAESPIWFGILHHLALFGLIGVVFVRLPWPAAALGAAFALAAPALLAQPLFDGPWLSWIGLATHDPSSNDFVPLLPWSAAGLIGILAGKLLLAVQQRPLGQRLAGWSPAAAPARLISRLGRHTLAIYLIHQPLLFGVFYFWLWLGGSVLEPGPTLVPHQGGSAPPPLPAAIEPRPEGFLGSCQVSCEKSGGTMNVCAGYCRCVVEDLAQLKLWQPFMKDQLDRAGEQQMTAVIQGCIGKQKR